MPDGTWKAIFVPATAQHGAWVCSNVRAAVCDEELIGAIERRIGATVFPSEPHD